LRLTTCAALAVAGGCSHQKQTRTVRVADLGNPESSRIYNFMNATSGEVETRSDHLMDEAVIAELDSSKACFHLIVRSEHSIDVHPSQWEVKVNDVVAHVEQDGEADQKFWDTTYTRMETAFVRESPRGTTEVRRPVEYEGVGGYAVRRARLCAPLDKPAGTLTLEVVIPGAGPGDMDWGQVFEWRLM
ncbi:MAG TPA: hypothetical protein VKZ63_05135, partial [Kofleriaceae bacterium]|nr:hypothetical protein [Kofleriaceae bacterium]